MTRQEKIDAIVAWFRERNNAWATIEEVIDSVEGLLWDGPTRHIFQTSVSGGVFENRFLGGKNATSTRDVPIAKSMKRVYRVKEAVYIGINYFPAKRNK